VPVALITAADGVCHPTSAAIIGRQHRRGWRSIYRDRTIITESCWKRSLTVVIIIKIYRKLTLTQTLTLT